MCNPPGSPELGIHIHFDPSHAAWMIEQKGQLVMVSQDCDQILAWLLQRDLILMEVVAERIEGVTVKVLKSTNHPHPESRKNED
mgnify:CR=1 FL=1